MLNHTFEMIVCFITLAIVAFVVICVALLLIQSEYLIKKSEIYKRGFEHGFTRHEQTILKIAYRNSGCNWKPTDAQKYSNGYIAGVQKYEKQKCDEWVEAISKRDRDSLKKL